MSQPQDTHTFVVLYAGRTIAEARVIAASSDPELVQTAALKMLGEVEANPNGVCNLAVAGRRHALLLITQTER